MVHNHHLTITYLTKGWEGLNISRGYDQVHESDCIYGVFEVLRWYLGGISDFCFRISRRSVRLSHRLSHRDISDCLTLHRGYVCTWLVSRDSLGCLTLTLLRGYMKINWHYFRGISCYVAVNQWHWQQIWTWTWTMWLFICRVNILSKSWLSGFLGILLKNFICTKIILPK